MHRKKRKIKRQPIYCGQDIRNWLGYRIIAVQSNKLDRNVRVTLASDDGHAVKVFLDDMCIDGELLHYAEEPQAVRHE